MRSIRLAAFLCAATCLTGSAALAGDPISFIGPVTLPNGQPSVSNRLVGPSDPLPVTCPDATCGGSAWTKDAAAAVTLSPTTSTSAATHLTGTGGVVGVENQGTVDVYVLTSASSTVQAATTDVVVHPGQVQAVANLGYISAITASGTGSLRITTGTGDPRPSFSASYSAPSIIAGRDGSTAQSLSNPGIQTQVGASDTGNSSSHSVVASSTTPVAIDTSPGTLYSVQVFNNSATIAYLKLYDAAAGSTTCGSGTPKKVIMIPANTAGAGAVVPVGGAAGVKFSTAITRCVVLGIDDSSAAAPTASTYLVEVDYK